MRYLFITATRLARPRTWMALCVLASLVATGAPAQNAAQIGQCPFEGVTDDCRPAAFIDAMPACSYPSPARRRAVPH